MRVSLAKRAISPQRRGLLNADGGRWRQNWVQSDLLWFSRGILEQFRELFCSRPAPRYPISAGKTL